MFQAFAYITVQALEHAVLYSLAGGWKNIFEGFTRYKAFYLVNPIKYSYKSVDIDGIFANTQLEKGFLNIINSNYYFVLSSLYSNGLKCDKGILKESLKSTSSVTTAESILQLYTELGDNIPSVPHKNKNISELISSYQESFKEIPSELKEFTKPYMNKYLYLFCASTLALNYCSTFYTPLGITAVATITFSYMVSELLQDMFYDFKKHIEKPQTEANNYNMDMHSYP